MATFPMRRLLALVSLMAMVATPAAVRAQFTPISDDFSTAGSLSGSTPDSGVGNWTSINSSSPALAVSGGALTIAGSAGEASQLNFASGNLSAGIIYMGFDMVISNSVSIGTSASISAIAGFRAGTPTSGSYALGFGVFRPTGAAQTNSTLPSTSTGEYVVGIFGGSSLNAESNDLAGWGTALARGDSYRVVVGFDLSNDAATLWIDPTSVSSTSISVTGITADARGVFFRQGSSGHGEASIDNLLVGNSFNAVAAIPEPSMLGVLAGSAVFGVILSSRRGRGALAV